MSESERFEVNLANWLQDATGIQLVMLLALLRAELSDRCWPGIRPLDEAHAMVNRYVQNHRLSKNLA